MKILFVSLGCDKNSVDSQVMLGVLSKAGHSFVDDETEAEAVIINTCCFINDAKEESIETIIEFGRMRTAGEIRALIVTGCLGQRYTSQIHTELPEVDAIVGIASINRISDALDLVLRGTPRDFLDPLNTPIHANHKRVITSGGFYDYLKIAEGCDKHCTYCVIPKIRGSYRSALMDELVAEATELANSGVKELILVAQETTVYGVDIYGKKSLPELLHKLCTIDGLEIIRLLYCYPEEITDELIECVKSEPKIAHYLDMPIQSGADRILKLMGRRTTADEIRSLVDKLRNAIPDICLRTTLITGFPGETAEDHRETMRFVSDMEFDHLGVFMYSQEEDTPAAKMKNQVPKFVKKKRYKQLMELQQPIAFKKTEEMVGRKVKAIVEGAIPEDRIYVGRTYKDAPSVDGYLFINSEHELISGDIVEVLITDANEYDLIGELV